MNRISNFAFIIGAMKCGTTSLFEYLSQHPQISPCTYKEPNFFSNEDKWENGFEWYQNLWQWNSSTHKIALEASVNYSKAHKFPYVVSRIADLEAKCKFIYIIRNPLKRIESHYIHGVANRWEGCSNKLSKEVSSHLIETSKYAKQLDAFCQRFSEDDILLLNFNDLKDNPKSLLRQVCQFLNIQSDYEFDFNKIHNVNQGRIADHSIYFLIKKNKSLKTITNIVPSPIKQKIRHKLSYELEVDAKLSEPQRESILQELIPDLKKLKNKYNFDVSSWGINI